MSDLNWCICGKATSDNVFYCSHDCQVADASAFATSTPPSPPSAQTHFVNNAIHSIDHQYQDHGLGNYTLMRSLATSKRSARETIPAPYHSIGSIKQGMDTCVVFIKDENKNKKKREYSQRPQPVGNNWKTKEIRKEMDMNWCLVCGKATSNDSELYCSHLCCMQDGDKSRIDPSLHDHHSSNKSLNINSHHMLHEPPPPLSLSSPFGETYSPSKNLSAPPGMTLSPQQLKWDPSVQHIGPLFPATNTCATVLDHFGLMSRMRGSPSMNSPKTDATASLYAAFSFNNRKKRVR
ncbi:hypothetical protein BJ741DRAFT_650235 [Chytriomyces cf. hyalinus JEL632]|nr:hypothetical protein BJ741DRAFT_650235 [Chytriomyces cf. hyalinus JEL632]